MKLFEMEGFLRGKCLPGDMKVNETNAEYLVRKFTELEQKLAESQREFRADDATIENPQMQVEQLAAENVGLKATSDDRRMFIMNGVQLGYIKVPTVQTDPALEPIRIALSPQETTPASDRIVAGIKADGVEEWVSSRGGRWNGTTEEALKFAKQLREGAK